MREGHPEGTNVVMENKRNFYGGEEALHVALPEDLTERAQRARRR